MSGLPESIAEGSMHILGVELKYHVLDDGRRIIEAAGVQALFAKMAGLGLSGNEIDEISREAFGHAHD